MAKVTFHRFSALLVVHLILVAGCTGRPDGLTPVDRFDANRYMGKWFEIMRLDHRFERGLTNVTATYRLRKDGSVNVINRGFSRTKCRWKTAQGTARFQGSQKIASLSVTFFWPFAGGYHVVALDRKGYRYALISGPSRRYLWVLSRTPSLSTNVKAKLLARARALGFATDKLILVDHGKPNCPKAG